MIVHLTKTENRYLCELSSWLKYIDTVTIQQLPAHQKKLTRMIEHNIDKLDKSIDEWDSECGTGNDMSKSLRGSQALLDDLLNDIKSNKNKFFALERAIVRLL